MKNDPKSPFKSLVLKKETVRTLQRDDLAGVEGGRAAAKTQCSVGYWGCCMTSRTIETLTV